MKTPLLFPVCFASHRWVAHRAFLTIFLLAVGTFFSASGVSAQQRSNIVVGYSAITAAQSTPWIIQEAGLFKKYNLNAHLVYIATTTMAQAIIAGDVQIAQNNGPQVVDAVLAGADNVFIGGTTNAFTFYLIVAPEIKTVEDLRGKPIGVTRLRSSTEFAARLLFKKFGLNPDKDVKIFQTGGLPESVAALQSGVVKGALLSSPADLRARSLGFKELADMATMGIAFQNSGIVTTRSFLKSHRDTVRRYLMAYIEGLHIFYTNKKLSMDVIKKYTSTNDPRMLETAYDYATKVLQRIPYLTLEGIQTVVDMVAEVNPKARSYKAADFVDLSLLQELEQEGFIRKVWAN